MLAAGLFFPMVMGSAQAESPTSMVNKDIKHSWFQVGRASWYGLKFMGKRTANGEKFDSNAMTAAHRTLPLGSWVKVTNLRNKKSVVVKINDRGPYVGSRMLDLSQAAARVLGFSGTASVKMELVSPGSTVASLNSPAFAH